MPDEKIGTTYHSLTAGMTTYLPDGRPVAFGGPIRKGEGFVTVGQGSYTTKDPDEIAWLDGLCAMKAPQVWKESLDETTVTDIPAAVAGGSVKDTVVVLQEVVEQAATSATADAKSGDGAAAAAAQKLLGQ